MAMTTGTLNTPMTTWRRVQYGFWHVLALTSAVWTQIDLSHHYNGHAAMHMAIFVGGRYFAHLVKFHGNED